MLPFTGCSDFLLHLDMILLSKTNWNALQKKTLAILLNTHVFDYIEMVCGNNA